MFKKIDKKITKYLNYDKKFNKVDLLTITIIVLLYSLLSFYRLGSNVSPNTFERFNKEDKLIIELKEETDVIKMKIFSGEQNSKYHLYLSRDNELYDYYGEVEGRGAFSWDFIKPKMKAKYLMLEFSDNSTIGEIALYDNSQEKIEVKNITCNDKIIKTLNDEQNTIPDKISYMNTSYFDEIYFARTAYEYKENIPTYEWTHPPLGKIIQAIPMFITDHLSPFNYRLMGNISGIMMIIIMYLFGKELFKKRKYSIFASLLMFFDTFHFVQTRMGTVDSHLVLFMMISVLGMIKYCNNQKIINLLVSGIFFGCAVSVKWTGMYCGLGLAIIYFTYLLKNKQFNLKHILFGTSFFIVIPLIIYISCYLMFPNNNINYTDNLGSIIKQQEAMYNYHSKLEAEHPYSSSWYTWPISYRPVWYHLSDYGDKTRETIAGYGNIVIWWIGILAMLYLIPKLIKTKDKNSYQLLIMIMSLWLPYAFIGRIMFLYHYFPVIPFMMLAIVNLFKDLEEKLKLKYLIPIYMVFVILFFIVYYPAISGSTITIDFIKKIKIFKSWPF